MTTPFLYCMLDLILNYHLPPATVDESDNWDYNEAVPIINYIISQPTPKPSDEYHPPPGKDEDLGYDDENYGEDWKNNL